MSMYCNESHLKKDESPIDSNNGGNLISTNDLQSQNVCECICRTLTIEDKSIFFKTGQL